LRIYYGGRTYQHNPYKGKNTAGDGGGIGFASLKRGRFVSMEASYDGGTIISKPLLFNGSQLFLNANCRFGSIGVTLLDEQGNEIPGWTTTTKGNDAISIAVNFDQGDLKKFIGKKTSIKFILSNAQLYGFRIKY
jgi:hypothetical protein